MPPPPLPEYHRMCVPPPVQAATAIDNGFMNLMALRSMVQPCDQSVQTALDPLPVMPVIIQNTVAASAINPPLLKLSNGQVGQPVLPVQQALPMDPTAIVMVPQPPQPIQLVPNNPTNPVAHAPIYPFGNQGATDTNIFPAYIPPPAQLIQHIWNHPSTTDTLFLEPNSESIPFNGNFFFAPYYSNNSNSNCNTTSSASKQLYDEGWGDSTEEEQLLLRRNEIISRLGQIIRPCSQVDENNLEDDLESHVSFTVANSVLSDPIYAGSCEEQKGQETINPIELPPLHMGHSAVGQLQMNSNTAISQTSLSMLNTMTYSMARDSSKPSLCSTIRTACPSSYSHSQESTTVQADCSIMNIKDVIDQPLVISSLQHQNLSPQATYDMVDPCNLMEQLPTTIKPLQMMPCGDPQDFVACSLDRIMEMKERISDVEKNNVLSSAVEKEQMKVELRIASRQISSLDEQTKESCLLKELKAVDEKIENLNINV
uniref:Uncharacterized protein n=1 Tax=Ditylenchus dipsaci TaxID=166011 RepID=A0A915CNV2_9BILA